MILDLTQTKTFLRVDITDDDTLIQTLMTAAESYLIKATGNVYDSTNSLAQMVCLMLVAEWYTNRENAQQLSVGPNSVLNGLIAQLAMSTDISPPQIPTGLTATIETLDVWLRWLSNAEPNIDGYNVYRDGTKLNTDLVRRRRINDVEFWMWDEFVSVPPNTAPGVVGYRDSSVTSGQTYSYQVTAVDNLGNESAKTTAVQVAP